VSEEGDGVNASDLISRVASRTPYSRKTVRAIIDAALDEITRGLGAEQRVSLSGFGTFEVRQRRERPGRNPLTGAPLTLPSRSAVVFRAGTGLRGALQPGRNGVDQE
jgi:DNA-binding protein HU-beta